LLLLSAKKSEQLHRQMNEHGYERQDEVDGKCLVTDTPVPELEEQPSEESPPRRQPDCPEGHGRTARGSMDVAGIEASTCRSFIEVMSG